MTRRLGTACIASVFLAAACTTTPSPPATGPSGSLATDLPASAEPTPRPTPTAVPVAGGPIEEAGVTSTGAIWTIGGNVLAVSTDLGTTWRRASMPPSGTAGRPLPAFVLDARHAWVITLTPGSIDSGNGPDFDHAQLIVNRTVDGGETWQTASVPGDYPDTERSLVFADDQHGYLMVSGGRTNSGSSTILRSDDGGATWTIAQSVEANDQGSLGSLIAVSDGPTLWSAAQEEAGPVNHPILAVSDDGGRTWASVPLPGVLARWGGTQNLPLGPPVFLTSELGFFALTSSDDATAGNAPGESRTLVYSTVDGGGGWTRQASLPFEVGDALAFVTATSWVASVTGLPATLEITTDAGATWRAVHPTGVPAGSFESIQPIDGTKLLGRVLVGGNSGNPQVVAVSSDGGATWQPIAP